MVLDTFGLVDITKLVILGLVGLFSLHFDPLTSLSKTKSNPFSFSLNGLKALLYISPIYFALKGLMMIAPLPTEA